MAITLAQGRYFTRSQSKDKAIPGPLAVNTRSSTSEEPHDQVDASLSQRSSPFSPLTGGLAKMGSEALKPFSSVAVLP